MLKSYLVFMIFSISPGVIKSQSIKNTLARTTDWGLHLYHDKDAFNLEEILGDSAVKNKARVIREGLLDITNSYNKNHDGTGLSVILPWECEHAVCKAAKTDCSIKLDAGDKDDILKVILRRGQDKLTWLAGCKKFAKVELGIDDGGMPGARSLDKSSSDRGRLHSGDVPDLSSRARSAAARPGVLTPIIESIYNEDEVETVNVTDPSNQTLQVTLNHVPSVPCTQTEFNKNQVLFYTECCLKVEPKIALNNDLCRLQAFMNRMLSTTTPAPTRLSQEDLSKLARNFDEENLQKNKTMDVVFKELNTESASWKHKYYMTLGFFIVFLLIFLIVVGFMMFKIKSSKSVTPPASPGMNLSVPGVVQPRRGYSTVSDGDQEDREPLTPATQQAQTFNY